VDWLAGHSYDAYFPAPAARAVWPTSVVRELVTWAGVVPVVAAVELTGERAGLLAELWDAGVSEVVDLRPAPTTAA